MLPSLQGLSAGVAGALLAAGVALGALFLVGVDPQMFRSPGVSRIRAALSSPALARRFGAAVLVAVLTLVVTRWLVGAGAAFALVMSWDRLFGGAALERRQLAHLEALVMWTESMRDILAGDGDLEEAIPLSVSSAPVLIRPQLNRMQDLTRRNVPLSVALYALAAELKDASADVVIGSLIINTMHSGEGLTEVLSRLVAASRGELDLRRRVLAGRASTRRAAKVMLAVTVGLAVGLRVFDSTYVKPYATVTGQLVLLVVVAIFAAAFLWLRQLSGGADPEPFLAGPDGGYTIEDRQLIDALSALAATSAGRPGSRTAVRP